MKRKFRVAMTQAANITVVIEAENAKEARQVADRDGAYEGLCHQCAREIDLDPMGWEVTDEMPDLER